MLDRKQFLAMAGFLPLTLTGSADAAPAAPPGLDDFCTLFYHRKQVRVAFERYVAPDYIQHSSGMAPGRAAAIAVLEPMFARPHFSATPVGTLNAGALSIVMLDVRVGPDVRAAVMDIFRWQDGLIREHWDLKQVLTAQQAEGYFDRLHP